jgi:hypothetical protein
MLSDYIFPCVMSALIGSFFTACFIVAIGVVCGVVFGCGYCIYNHVNKFNDLVTEVASLKVQLNKNHKMNDSLNNINTLVNTILDSAPVVTTLVAPAPVAPAPAPAPAVAPAPAPAVAPAPAAGEPR